MAPGTPSMRVAMLLSFGLIIAAPAASFAQVPDLADKAQELAAEVRERGAELGPLYQDVDVTTPPAHRAHKARPQPRSHAPRENNRAHRSSHHPAP